MSSCKSSYLSLGHLYMCKTHHYTLQLSRSCRLLGQHIHFQDNSRIHPGKRHPIRFLNRKDRRQLRTGHSLDLQGSSQQAEIHRKPILQALRSRGLEYTRRMFHRHKSHHHKEHLNRSYKPLNLYIRQEVYTIHPHQLQGNRSYML